MAPPVQFNKNLDAEAMAADIFVLQSIIEGNINLKGLEPLQLGQQGWQDMRLESLDISNMDITYLPAEICRILPQLVSFNLDDNAICPPYPVCIDYVGMQQKETCGEFECPSGYSQINEECYYIDHLQVIEEIILLNTSISSYKTLEIGIQKWQNGKLEQLILNGLKLEVLPQNFCTLAQVNTVDISNNRICPPYPPCLENHFIGFQELSHCNKAFPCPENHVAFDNNCYYYNDLQVLIDITRENNHLSSYHPLLLGNQVWRNSRLHMLYINNLDISKLPASVSDLDKLQYLYLNDNLLASLPQGLCEIYPNLRGIELSNNKLCPPYLECFAFIGNQNTENCEFQFCPYGYMEINEKCYWETDIAVLKEFIENNKSLKGRLPLEIGVQKWKNMHLDFLYLGVNDLTEIPESICKIFGIRILFTFSSVKISTIHQNRMFFGAFIKCS